MLPLISVSVLALALAIGAYLLYRQLGSTKTMRSELLLHHEALTQQYEALIQRFKPVVDADSELQRLGAEIASQQQKLRTDQEAALALQQKQESESQALRQKQERETQTLQQQIEHLQAEFSTLDEEANLQSFGHYKPRYDFATASKYQSQLDGIREQQKFMLRLKEAAICPVEWSVGNSKVEGRKMTDRSLKLMLRAFNGECDAAVAKVKYNNIVVMEKRIRTAFAALNDLGEVQQCSIVERYLNLKLEELFLAHEYQEKVQAEKEEQRRVREQMREEEVAQRELDKARLDAEKEEKRYADALRKAQEEVSKAVGEKQTKLLAQIELLQQQLTQAQQQKARAISQAQLTRSGHVYVISNIGSFGEDVYKIGMTRRLEPMDRVRELGDASVPFQFDVHAIIYCDDAPALENALHRIFHHRRLNLVNEKKEFFRVSLTEIAEAVHRHHGQIEFLHEAEAVEYRKTMAMQAKERATTN